jgi:hypothetical protein
MRWGKIRAAWTKAGPGYWDWGPEVALVAKWVAAPEEAPVAQWASDLAARVVVKQWEKVPEGRLELQAWAAERGHGTKSGWLCARNRS